MSPTADDTTEMDIVDAVIVEDEAEHRLVSDAKAMLQSIDVGRELGWLTRIHEQQRVAEQVKRMFAAAAVQVPLPPVVAGIGNLFDAGHDDAAVHMEMARWGLNHRPRRAGGWVPGRPRR